MEEHRHHQAPVFTPAQVRLKRSAEIEENLSVIGTAGVDLQAEEDKVHGKKDDCGDGPIAAGRNLVKLRAWGKGMG